MSPQRVRQYARTRGLLAKTDRIDAQVLADFGKILQPRLFVGKSMERKAVSALVTRRKQLEDMLLAEKNCRRTSSTEICSALQKMIQYLIAEMKAMDEKIYMFMQEHADFQKQEQLLRSAKSIGPVTAATLLANLPELG